MFSIGQKVQIVKDAMGHKYPTPLPSFEVVAIRGKTYQLRSHGIDSEFLEEWQLEVE